MRAVAATLTALCAGCIFDTSGLSSDSRNVRPEPTIDRSAVERVSDLGGIGDRFAPAAEARADRTAAVAPDAVPPDRTPSKPDAHPVDQSQPTKTCDQIYGKAPSYQKCDEKLASCTFYTDNGSKDRSCDTICQTYGGTCLQAWNQSGTNCPPSTTVYKCDETHGDLVCKCTRF